VFVACSTGSAGYFKNFYDIQNNGTAYNFDQDIEALDIAVSGSSVVVATGSEGMYLLELIKGNWGHYYYWSGSSRIRELADVLDTAAKIITAAPNHMSEWAVLGLTNRISLPYVNC
jgi:hypothetical protein